MAALSLCVLFLNLRLAAQNPALQEDSQATSGLVWNLPSGVAYRLDVRTAPRPLRIHVLEIDLQQADLELDVVAGNDPDGDGPVEATLAPPLTLARSAHAFAAINTNAWSMFPDPATGKAPGYVVGGSADVKGWLKIFADQRSPQEAGYWSLWMDGGGNVQLGDVGGVDRGQYQDLDHARWAISGFQGILRDGKILRGQDEILHPRTAIGITPDSKKLIWMVVDGRQPGISEGVSEHELAGLLQEFGAMDGINLDGGGSSVLLLADRDGRLRPANRPSGIGMRPVPSILVIRSRRTDEKP